MAEAALDEGALRLDFEDWFAKLPKRIRDGHSVKEIRQWFDSADDNGDGVLSVDEFFSFTLSDAAIKHGATSLANALRAFDTSSDKTGDLDLLAWEMMCDDMGFAKHAHDIFTSLDSDMSGTVSGDELATTLRSFDVSDVSLDTKKLVITLAWSWDERSQADARKALEAQAMSWRITGRDAETVRAQLQENLARSGAMVADLVKLFDDDNDTDLLIDNMEFIKAMRNRFGCNVTPWVLDEVFRSIDTDGSGEIGFDELFEFVRGRRHALDHRSREVRTLQLEPPPGAKWDLPDLLWNQDTLRNQIRDMLDRYGLTPADLLRGWDHSGDHALDRTEFLHSLADLFSAYPKLWKQKVKQVAGRTFAVIAGKGAGAGRTPEISMAELQRWLAAATRGPPVLAVDSNAAAAAEQAAKEAALAAQAKVEARRRNAVARVRAKQKVDKAIAKALAASSARNDAANAATVAAQMAEAERRAYVGLSLSPPSRGGARTPGLVPGSRPAFVLGDELLPRGLSTAPHQAEMTGLDGHASLMTTSFMTTSFATTSLVTSASEGRRHGAPVLQRWESDAHLPAALQSAPLRFPSAVPRTREEAFQADRCSHITLPPFRGVRLLRAVRQETQASADALSPQAGLASTAPEGLSRLAELLTHHGMSAADDKAKGGDIDGAQLPHMLPHSLQRSHTRSKRPTRTPMSKRGLPRSVSHPGTLKGSVVLARNGTMLSAEPSLLSLYLDGPTGSEGDELL